MGKWKVGDKCFALISKILGQGKNATLTRFGQANISTIVEGVLEDRIDKTKYRIRFSLPDASTILVECTAHVFKRSREELLHKQDVKATLVQNKASEFVTGDKVYAKAGDVLLQQDVGDWLHGDWQEHMVTGYLLSWNADTVTVNWCVNHGLRVKTTVPIAVVTHIGRTVTPVHQGASGSDSAVRSASQAREGWGLGSKPSGSPNELHETDSQVDASEDDEFDCFDDDDDDNYAVMPGEKHDQEPEDGFEAPAGNWVDQCIPSDHELSRRLERCSQFVYPCMSPVDYMSDVCDGKLNPLEALLLVLPHEEDLLELVNRTKPPQVKDITMDELLIFIALMCISTWIRVPQHILWKRSTENPMFRLPYFGTYMNRNRFYSISKVMDSSRPGVGAFQDVKEFVSKVMEAPLKRVNIRGGMLVPDHSTISLHGKATSNKSQANKRFPPGMFPKAHKANHMGLDVTTSTILLEGGFALMVYAEIAAAASTLYDTMVPKSSAALIRATQFVRERHMQANLIVVSNTHFGSLLSTLALMKFNGLPAILAVKAHMQGFPKDELKASLAELPVGFHTSRTCTIEGVKLIALGWKVKDGLNAYFIASIGTTLQGSPVSRLVWSSEHSECTTVELRRPEIVQLYHEHFNVVNKHNKMHQAGFRLEQQVTGWRARCKLWALGVALTNALSLWQYAHRNVKSKDTSRNAFTNELLGLINNKCHIPNNEQVATGSVKKKLRSASHEFRSLKDHPYYKNSTKKSKYPQLDCRQCERRGCNSYCVDCTGEVNDPRKIFVLCPSCRDSHNDCV